MPVLGTIVEFPDWTHYAYDWSTAKESCQNMSGNLVSIHSDRENDFVNRLHRPRTSLKIWTRKTRQHLKKYLKNGSIFPRDFSGYKDQLYLWPYEVGFITLYQVVFK